MKKILFVINTLGRAGAEKALTELLKRLNDNKYEVYLYVIMGQGELIHDIPSHVRELNSRYDDSSVLTAAGRHQMAKKVCGAFFRNGSLFKKTGLLIKNMIVMAKSRRFSADKLLWRILSEGAQRFDISFDLAVAWLEGASAYYVAEYVKAGKKVVFIHIDYESAGYTRELDQGCYEDYDKIYTVSEEVRSHFLAFYPEYEGKTDVFHNIINKEEILRKAGEGGGFADGYEGFRILSVGRLTWQKAYDVAIEAMKILKDKEYQIRWYVLGEGDQRKKLEKKIKKLDLQDDFRLLGAVDNPYPYYVQTDLYVQAGRYEGKSIAIQEAQVLGCAVIASDRSGNREQIVDGEDGMLCELSPEAVAESVEKLYRDEEKRRAFKKAVQLKNLSGSHEFFF
ncbi:MAG: glycosyltransferase [Lachnospiraceae bacterium]|nr:glycosyltransferase [Lachnospiraceae bacterium]